MEQEPQARMLLDQMVHLLQEVAQQNPNVVERVKLQHISKNLVCTTNIPKTYYYCWLEAAASYKSVKIMILKQGFSNWGPGVHEKCEEKIILQNCSGTIFFVY